MLMLTEISSEQVHCKLKIPMHYSNPGYQSGVINSVESQMSIDEPVILRWSTPKAMSLDLQYCSSVYRVTPADVSSYIFKLAVDILSQVTSRPTICLINFVLSGKPVLLEQPRKNTATKLISHSLTCHGGN